MTIEDSSVDHVVHGEEARERLVAGAQKMADAVSVTMGPRGKLVVIDDGISVPHLTKDGVTVANAVKLEDRLENAGALILREAARRTASEAGDGTTTTSVLASSIMQSGLEWLKDDEILEREFFEGLDAALETALGELKRLNQPVESEEQIKHVATISANGDEALGSMLASAIEKLGPRATVLVEPGSTYDTSLEFVDGTELDRGFVSPHFVNDKSAAKCRFEKPMVVVINRRVGGLKELLPLLERASTTSRGLVMFAQDWEQDALKGLILNKTRGSLQVCACKLPEFGQAMHESADDLAALFGCQPILEGDFGESGSLSLQDAHVGACELIEITRNKTTVLKPQMDQESVEQRLAAVHEELDEGVETHDRAAVLQRRAQRLANGICVLRVGAATEVELREKLDRVDDAVNATRVAAMHGILPGGGESLRKVSKFLKAHTEFEIMDHSSKQAYLCMADALLRPFRVILANSLYNDEEVADLIDKEQGTDTVGFNALRGEVVDLVADGVIDPYYVTKSSLINALSVARKILEVGCIVTTGYEDFATTEV